MPFKAFLKLNYFLNWSTLEGKICSPFKGKNMLPMRSTLDVAFQALELTLPLTIWFINRYQNTKYFVDTF